MNIFVIWSKSDMKWYQYICDTYKMPKKKNNITFVGIFMKSTKEILWHLNDFFRIYCVLPKPNFTIVRLIEDKKMSELQWRAVQFFSAFLFPHKSVVRNDFLLSLIEFSSPFSLCNFLYNFLILPRKIFSTQKCFPFLNKILESNRA